MASRTATEAPPENGAWTPVTLRGITLANRAWLSPMCQYSSDPDGVPRDWHLAHYGARAAGGFGMVMVECTGISPDMRTTPNDLGIWSDAQVAGHRQLTRIIRGSGTVPALQLGAAGRKSSHGAPWDNSGTRRPVPPEQGGWQPIAPSAIPFAHLAAPRAMSSSDGARVLADLTLAARNADRAGYDVIELHAANGYLAHQFLSALSNHRQDDWGGDAGRRATFPVAMVRALRDGWPEEKPLLVRLPASDLLDGGITLDEAVDVAARMTSAGADMIDIESGTLVPEAPRPDGPLHNAHYGPGLKDAGLAVAASGGITDRRHLDEAVPELVDAAFVGRAALRDPYWALRQHAPNDAAFWPRQYQRAF